MGEQEQEVPLQLELGLDLAEPLPVPWWVEIIENETEGDQDTGWWGA